MADETSASPPYPIATDSAAAHQRRLRSSSTGATVLYFATIVASNSSCEYDRTAQDGNLIQHSGHGPAATSPPAATSASLPP